MCRSSIIQGFRIKPACASVSQRGLPISRLNKEEKEIAQAVSEGAFTATERCLKNPRTDFLIKINGVDI